MKTKLNMKTNKFILFAVFGIIYSATIFAQNNSSYYIKDGKVIESVRDNLEGLDKETPKDASWIKDYVNKAFTAYFNEPSVKVVAFDKSQIDKLNEGYKKRIDSLQLCRDNVEKILKDSIKSFDKERKNLVAQQKKDNKEIEKLNTAVSERKKEIENLKSTVSAHKKEIENLNNVWISIEDSLQDVISDKDSLLVVLKKDSEIASKVIEKQKKLKQTLYAKFCEANSSQSLTYLNADSIKSVVDQYEAFMQFSALPNEKDTEKQIAYLKTMTDVLDWYNNSLKYFDGQFNDTTRLELLRFVEQKHWNLTPGQNAELEDVKNALEGQISSVNHFREIVLKSLEGTPIAVALVDEKKRIIKEAVAFHSEDFEKAQYNKYYKSLNKALEVLLGGIKKMDKDEVNALLKEVKDRI